RWQRVDYSWNDHGFGGDCVYRFTRHVVDHLISGAPVMTAAEDYLTNLAVEEAVYASAADGKARTL
ncbi:MAG: gfo/Idh/MocA family oxidoreductase, partial [Pseudomonadota bacterium]